MTRLLTSIVIFAALFFGIAVAQNSVPYTRDEVATLKKKLVNALDAVGHPPAGYVKEKVVAAAMLSFLDNGPDSRSRMFERLDTFLHGKGKK